MFNRVTRQIEEEPPSTVAPRLLGKAGRYLLYILCVTPVALFPLGLVYRLVLL